ncbi:MAG: beta-lactamase family protein [Acidobacteria bacterium]|nr:beta-lactamase family protein [Acidobacteriota bacterium]
MRRRDFSLGFLPAAAQALRERKLLEAAGLVQRAVDAGQVRAATLQVRCRGERFERAFGEARTPETVFLIASITKPMTAAGVMLLADRGALSLGDPVRKFIPEFSGGDRSLVTIRHLLTHTSGLPDMLPENTAMRERHAPLPEFVERTIRTPLLFKPGTRVHYQSMGILLAAEIARRITGRPFAEFLEKEIFGPLGMRNTALGLGRFEIAGTARCQVEEAPGLYGGGRSDTRSWDWNSPYWRNLAAPWGGAHSTGADIANFLGYFLKPDGKVLRAETARAMVTNQTQGLNEPRGIGFAVAPGSFGNTCSARTFGHGGSTGTLAWADPARDLVCVVLTTLPARLSEKTLLKPVSDRVSEAVA